LGELGETKDRAWKLRKSRIKWGKKKSIDSEDRIIKKTSKYREGETWRSREKGKGGGKSNLEEHLLGRHNPVKARIHAMKRQHRQLKYQSRRARERQIWVQGGKGKKEKGTRANLRNNEV